jgi:hypothetical protein
MMSGDEKEPQDTSPGTGDGGAQGMRRGRMSGDRAGAGPGGACICPGCGREAPHKAGVPCNTLTCPWCGTRMTRA